MTDYFSRNNHNTFGGNIYDSDFNTDCPTTLSSIAARIASDCRFDQQCKRNIKIVKRKVKKENAIK